MHITALVAIPDCEQLCVCVCVCVYGCYARDTARGTPIFLVSRETAFNIPSDYTYSLDQEAWLYTLYSALCSHQTCGGIQNPGFRIEPHACGWMVKTHACGCIHCLIVKATQKSCTTLFIHSAVACTSTCFWTWLANSDYPRTTLLNINHSKRQLLITF